VRLRTVAGLLALACAGSVGGQSGSPRPPGPRIVVLVSVDGFRNDYLDRYPAPNLHRIIAGGVRAPLVPVFPTKTFPNHYTIVTGLLPEHHGIVENTMYDPVLDAAFRISDAAAVTDARWWGGEPLWVTAQRQGQIAAVFFWPGSEAPIEGVRPKYWTHYDTRVPDSTRVRQVLDWLTLPDSARPRFITLYFSEVDHAGHESGPDSPELAAAVLKVDRAIGVLLDGIQSRGLSGAVNVIVVSDHGMAPTSTDRVVALDDYIAPSLLGRVTGGNPVMGVWPRSGMEDSVYRALRGKHPHLSVWRRQEIPARFHYREHRRVPPLVLLADVGWAIAVTRRDLMEHPERFRGGAHGYDDTASVMRAIFLAQGPAFRSGVAAPAFRNVHIYDLIASILGLTPAANDGSQDSTMTLLR
jgi:predicted AlkP superfamily pyrophosphatase or phosphodiesterase